MSLVAEAEDVGKGKLTTASLAEDASGIDSETAGAATGGTDDTTATTSFSAGMEDDGAGELTTASLAEDVNGIGSRTAVKATDEMTVGPSAGRSPGDAALAIMLSGAGSRPVEDVMAGSLAMTDDDTG
jgi:hypothetical protein